MVNHQIVHVKWLRSVKVNMGPYIFRMIFNLKMDLFPPLTLVLRDSGRDNQLRVKSPPMIVIIS